MRRSQSGTIDDYGDEVQDVTLIATLCELQQQQRSEDGEMGEASKDTWRLFFAAGESIDTGDAVELDGEVYELTGDPWLVRNPRTGSNSHIEATARRTAGANDGS